jgi:hypothetical protein
LQPFFCESDGPNLAPGKDQHPRRLAFSGFRSAIVGLQHALGRASRNAALRHHSHFVKHENEDMGFLRSVTPGHKGQPNAVSSWKIVTRARFERAFPSPIDGLQPVVRLILAASYSSAAPFQLRSIPFRHDQGLPNRLIVLAK